MPRDREPKARPGLFIVIHDGYFEHPKIVKAGGDAGWLDAAAMGYCSRNHTDGIVPKEQVSRVSDRRQPMKLAAKLVEVRRWHERGHDCARCVQPGEDEFVIHDYLDWQRSAAEVAETRVEKSRAGGKGNHRRWHVDRDMPEAECPHCIAEGIAPAIAESSQVRSQVRSQSESHGESQVRSQVRSQKGSQNDRRTSPEVEVEKEPIGHLGSSSAVDVPRETEKAAAATAAALFADRPLQDNPDARALLRRVVATGAYDAGVLNVALDALARQNLPITQRTLAIELDGPPRPDSNGRARDHPTTDKAVGWLELARDTTHPDTRAIGGTT